MIIVKANVVLKQSETVVLTDKAFDSIFEQLIGKIGSKVSYDFNNEGVGVLRNVVKYEDRVEAEIELDEKALSKAVMKHTVKGIGCSFNAITDPLNTDPIVRVDGVELVEVSMVQEPMAGYEISDIKDAPEPSNKTS